MLQASNWQAELPLRRKDDLLVAFWNVRTLQDVGAQALTMWELRKYIVDIACLLESRIPDSGNSVIKVPGEEACYHLYHSGLVGNLGRHGAAIALSKAAPAALSSRLASARPRCFLGNLRFVRLYKKVLHTNVLRQACSTRIHCRQNFHSPAILHNSFQSLKSEVFRVWRRITN